MKNVTTQASKKKSTGSLSHRSYKASVTYSRRDQTMETRSMAKATEPGIILIDEVQNIQLQSPICEIEDYYNNNSSSSSLKGVCISEIKVESSKTVVIPTMMGGSTTLEEEMATMKVILEKLTRESAIKGSVHQASRRKDC